LNSAFLHVIGDAISSVGVIVAAILIHFTKLTWFDPLVSMLIGVIILVSSYRVLRGSLHILVEGVPEGLSTHQINERISSLHGVAEVHDLHVWNICSGTVALSAHIVLDYEKVDDSSQQMQNIKQLLSDEFKIDHTTIQFENCPCMQGHGGCN
jgi:cobalt-zinc-cadmium efflux system protein